jgi:hypothetical protein
MEKIFWLRKGYQVKKMKPIAEVLKLVLNSVWGKDMQRTFYENTTIERKDEIIRKMGDERNTIKEYSDFADGLVLVKSASKKIPESRAHVASEVLGCSKYLMIRWMDVLDKLGIKYFYSDTNSVIMEEEGYAPARKEFKKLYGFDIDGDDDSHKRKNPPGTLHPDFKPEDVVYADELIAVGKKVYYMSCVRSNGERCEVYKFKGMTTPEVTIPRYCRENGITVRDFFMKLLYGEELIVPLVYEHSAPSFAMDPKNWSFKTNREFTRTFSFDGEIEETNLNSKYSLIEKDIVSVANLFKEELFIDVIVDGVVVNMPAHHTHKVEMLNGKMVVVPVTHVWW